MKDAYALAALLLSLSPAWADPAPETIVVTARKTPELEKKNDALDAARDRVLLPKLGASQYTLSQKAIDALPQGEDTAIDKVLLQAPGVSADTAISNPDFHIRNEYANVQYRIDGIQLPDGVSALGPVLETGFIGNLNLLDGALPAQYGLHTAGVVDMSTKPHFDDGGTLALNLGSQATFSPSLDLQGSSGRSVYFLTGRYLTSNEGLESATPGPNPIHDHTTQEKLFGYGATILNDSTRLSYMAGAFVGKFQIPDVAGQSPLGDYGPSSLSSSAINENETDVFWFAMAALQTHRDDFDSQLSVFTRSASTDFRPDVEYDLAFNDAAAQASRRSLLNGVQYDSAYRANAAHTLRAGLIFSVEQTHVRDLSIVLPLDEAGAPLPTPVDIADSTSRLGWTEGAYVQDEWRLLPALTLNTGVRFDQISKYIAANQVSPRLALMYTPSETTTLHAGVARYFTPPSQAQSTPNNLALFKNTVQQPVVTQDDPVQPERATYFDAGWDQTIGQRLNFGADIYYKLSKDTLDDGQFGRAVVLDQYNYVHGYSKGAEFKAGYSQDGWRVYANFSAELTKAKKIASEQYLIGDPVELAYLASHYTYASDAQTFTGSWGGSYRWHDWAGSIDGIYGSGLRTGFANEDHTPGYTQWNAAVWRRFDLWHDHKALTLRLSVINLFDKSYILRSGDGIGEFAPQYGPRREVFLGISQTF